MKQEITKKEILEEGLYRVDGWYFLSSGYIRETSIHKYPEDKVHLAQRDAQKIIDMINFEKTAENISLNETNNLESLKKSEEFVEKYSYILSMKKEVDKHKDTIEKCQKTLKFIDQATEALLSLDDIDCPIEKLVILINNQFLYAR